MPSKVCNALLLLIVPVFNVFVFFVTMGNYIKTKVEILGFRTICVVGVKSPQPKLNKKASIR